MPDFTINPSETFEHLPHAPITEAIIQVRGRGVAPWEEAGTVAHLKTVLPDYPRSESQRIFEQQLNPASPTPMIDRGWTGVVFRNAANTQIANFQRDSFTFSRLAPYENWECFSAEALRLCQIHIQYAQLHQTQRIGLRFINQFDAPSEPFELSKFFIQPLPPAYSELPFPRARFFHQDTFVVPNYAYQVTVTRTFQPALSVQGQANPKLILDIDVFTTAISPATPEQISARLKEMRWLKNKLFFGSLTPDIIAKFK